MKFREKTKFILNTIEKLNDDQIDRLINDKMIKLEVEIKKKIEEIEIKIEENDLEIDFDFIGDRSKFDCHFDQFSLIVFPLF